MASSPTLLMRLVASAYSIAQKAGTIVRRVIAEGDLGIVEKVLKIPSNFTPTVFVLEGEPSVRVAPHSSRTVLGVETSSKLQGGIKELIFIIIPYCVTLLNPVKPHYFS